MTDDVKPVIANGRKAEILLRFADGQYLFSLKVPQIDELQRVCNASIFDIIDRVLMGKAFRADIHMTIFLGLVGGGTPAVKAQVLMETYVYNQPLASRDDPCNPLMLARSILSATIVGFNELEQDDQKKSPSADASESTSEVSERSS